MSKFTRQPQRLPQRPQYALEEKDVVYIKDGENLKSRKVKRGYLKHEEMNNFIMIYAAHQLIEGVRSIQNKSVPHMWETWSERGIMTPEQQKNLKMASTYIKKFSLDVYNNNFDIKTKDVVSKKAANWTLKVVDDYTIKKIYAMLDNSQEAHIPMEMFYDLIETKLEASCNGCTKNRNECELQTFFADRLIPPSDEGSECNCEYAYQRERG